MGFDDVIAAPVVCEMKTGRPSVSFERASWLDIFSYAAGLYMWFETEVESLLSS